MYKELKTEISSLAKQLQDLSEQFAKLEKDDMEDLKSSLCEAKKRIGNLESSHRQQGQSSCTRSTPDHAEINKQFLKTLSWEQVITPFSILSCDNNAWSHDDDTLSRDNYHMTSMHR